MIGRRAQDRKKKGGQVIVEVMLVLPVFLLIVFTIMDIGLMAFWMIVVNHATYEAARAGALLAGPNPTPLGSPDLSAATAERIVKKVFPNGQVSVLTRSEDTYPDMQAGTTNRDLIVTTKYVMKFSFPMSNMLLSSRVCCPQGPGNGSCEIAAEVRMPIEMPLRK